MIERNGDKSRPRLPRRRELRGLPGAETPSEGRGTGGRFAPGNRHGVDARAKHAINRTFGMTPESSLAQIDRDTLALYRATLRSLPGHNTMVRTLVDGFARQSTLSAHYHRVAVSLGLSSPEALAALDRSDRHGQRAERLIVSAVDIATRSKPTAASAMAAAPDVAAINARAERETQARRGQNTPVIAPEHEDNE